jgi:hypothetical protein
VICLSPPDGPNSFVTKSGYAFLVGADAGVIISKVNRSVQMSTPAEINLAQNYPNPFNPSTQIRYSLAKAGQVSLKVFNVLGQEVITLVNEEQPAGSYQVRFDATSLPNGTYFCRMHTAAFDKTTKMLLVK